MNSYNYSYNVLINRLEAFAAGHFLIKRFTHGQIDLADMDQDEQYPFMHVVPNNISPVDGGMQFDFQIIFADIPRDKELKAEYQREVISDCVRLAQDLIAEVKNGLVLFGFDVQLVTNPTIEPFMEEYKNTLTGVTFSLQLEVPWDWSACDIPAIWSVGGASGSGGSGTGYGITLRTNGVDNAVQNILDLVEGTNVTITDNGDGSVTIDAAGGGGGEFVSTEYNVNHTTSTGNQYVVGDRVWYNGSVYRCIANNDAINPSNPTYWTLQSVGYRLRQTPVDWNASTGDFQILNKPTIPATPTIFQYEIHVSQIDGNDTTGNGTLVNPVATITYALTLLTGSRKTIIVHPGTYTENVTVANTNTTIATTELTGANTLLSGTLTIGSLGSGSRISGLKMTNLVISGTAQAYISNCTVDTQVTKSSSGYVEIINSEMQCTLGIQISGSNITIINGNKNAGVSVSNASAQVIVKGCNSVVTPSASAGNLAIVDCIVTALGGNGVTITGASTTLTLINSQVLVSAGNNVAPISVAGIYSIINTLYDKPTSSLTGTSTNSIDYFQFINADKFIKQGGTASQYLMADGSVSTSVGGVTSVALTVPAAFTVTGSPITTSGTLAITAAGIAAQYIDGSGALQTFPTIPTALPPNGAAGGDLSGTYPNPTVHRIHGIDMQSGTPTANDIWLYGGSPAKWQHQAVKTVNSTSIFGSGDIATGTVTSVAALTIGTSGSDLGSTVANGTTTPVITLNVPTASAANRGALSSTDWSTFNGKQDSIGLTTVGTNLATLPNPSAIRYLRINADNTVSALTLAAIKTDLGISVTVLASDVVTSGTAYVDVTGLSFAVTANKTYKWRATVPYTSTSNINFSINGPTVTFNRYRFASANTATGNNVNNATTYDAGVAVTAVSGVATADGVIRPSANGTVIVRMRSSVSGGLTALAGSVIEFEEVL
jgi:hypothetical protein